MWKELAYFYRVKNETILKQWDLYSRGTFWYLLSLDNGDWTENPSTHRLSWAASILWSAFFNAKCRVLNASCLFVCWCSHVVSSLKAADWISFFSYRADCTVCSGRFSIFTPKSINSDSQVILCESSTIEESVSWPEIGMWHVVIQVMNFSMELKRKTRVWLWPCSNYGYTPTMSEGRDFFSHFDHL